MSRQSLPAEATWRVSLLGGLGLDDGLRRLDHLPSRAVAALLARLALWPERLHPREELVELLWPGVSIEIGRNRLRQALSTLRSLIEPPGGPTVLLADRRGVRVVPGAFVCDAREFESLLRQGRHAQALVLYRGELLPGYYDDWIDEERLRLAALRDRVPQSANLPTPAAIVDPPMPGTRTASARVMLPAYLTRLFGAEEQIARLLECVPRHRLVTLIGPGGGGKTRLAIATARWLLVDDASASPAAEPFDLVAFVPMVSCTTRAQACDALTGALQLAPGADDPIVAVTDALTGRHALLVLDNFEQLVDLAQDLVAQLLGLLPALHLVVTSRRVLGLDGEREFAVSALDLPAAGADFAAAGANPAVSMFVDRARAVRADFHLTQRNAPTLVALVRELHGMPLAVELAASRVRSIAPEDMLQRLRGRGTPSLDLLSRAGPRGALDRRHASMQRVIEWSWSQLDAGQARLLSALTVFADGFTAEAAQVLAGDVQGHAPGESPDDAQLLLDDLVARSLVHAREGIDGALRFGLYPPIREYAASELDGPQALHWRGRLRVWALHWARALPPTPPLEALRVEMPNLLAALASAVDDSAPQDGVRLLLSLRRCLEDVELSAEGLACAIRAVEQTADRQLQARGHSLLGPMLFTAGQPEAALRHAELAIDCDALEASQHARALHGLALVRWRSRRRAGEVEPLLDEADVLAEATGDLELRASLLALRAFVTNAHHGDRGRAEHLHAQALSLWDQSGNQHAIQSGRYNLAVCAQGANRHRAALQLLEPIIASARELQDWRRLSQSLNVRGNAHSGLRQWHSAVADYQDCVRTAWDSLASYDLAYGLWNLPRALAHLRRPEAALRLAAYADRFWRTRFGDLSADDQRYLLRVRRLAARQIGAAGIEPHWREGAALSPAQAVALALSLY